MKLRYFKRRARRPDFRLTRTGATIFVEVKSHAAMVRFFGPTCSNTEGAWKFFGAQPESVG